MKKWILIIASAFTFFSCGSFYHVGTSQNFSQRITTNTKRLPKQENTKLSSGNYVLSPSNKSLNNRGINGVWPSGRHNWMHHN